MIPVLLTKIKTRDGVTLDGIYVRPKRKSKTAIIWLHGLTSYFHSGQPLIKEFSSRCSRAGIGYFKFDTRGHDIVVRGHGKNTFLGTIFEKFEDCVYDIRAMIGLAKSLGYRNIFLAGHSTGANKAVYYMYKTHDRRVKGVVLAGALSDIAAEIKRVGKTEFGQKVRLAKRLYRKNPNTFFVSRGFLFTAHRFLSLHIPGTKEDVFPYYNASAKWKELKSIQVPIAIIIGSRDEYLDLPTKKYLDIFKKNARLARDFSGIVVRGANHGFYKREKELTNEIINWIKRKQI